jgi:hypothetical protein
MSLDRIDNNSESASLLASTALPHAELNLVSLSGPIDNNAVALPKVSELPNGELAKASSFTNNGQCLTDGPGTFWKLLTRTTWL